MPFDIHAAIAAWVRAEAVRQSAAPPPRLSSSEAAPAAPDTPGSPDAPGPPVSAEPPSSRRPRRVLRPWPSRGFIRRAVAAAHAALRTAVAVALRRRRG